MDTLQVVIPNMKKVTAGWKKHTIWQCVDELFSQYLTGKFKLEYYTQYKFQTKILIFDKCC